MMLFGRYSRKKNVTLFLAHETNSRSRFERLHCLVEMGEWMVGRGWNEFGMDYLRSALDLLYDVEEQVFDMLKGRALERVRRLSSPLCRFETRK